MVIQRAVVGRLECGSLLPLWRAEACFRRITKFLIVSSSGWAIAFGGLRRPAVRTPARLRLRRPAVRKGCVFPERVEIKYPLGDSASRRHPVVII